MLASHLDQDAPVGTTYVNEFRAKGLPADAGSVTLHACYVLPVSEWGLLFL